MLKELVQLTNRVRLELNSGKSTTNGTLFSAGGPPPPPPALDDVYEHDRADSTGHDRQQNHEEQKSLGQSLVDRQIRSSGL